MSLENFNEGYKPKHVEPAFGNDGSVEFDMESVIDRLDGQDGDGEGVKTASGHDAAEAISELFKWMSVCKVRKDDRAINFIGKRAIAAMWVVNPALFENAPAHMVAKSFGISLFNFSRLTSEFSRRFKINNRFQAHDGKNNH